VTNLLKVVWDYLYDLQVFVLIEKGWLHVYLLLISLVLCTIPQLARSHQIFHKIIIKYEISFLL